MLLLMMWLRGVMLVVLTVVTGLMLLLLLPVGTEVVVHMMIPWVNSITVDEVNSVLGE